MLAKCCLCHVTFKYCFVCFCRACILVAKIVVVSKRYRFRSLCIQPNHVWLAQPADKEPIHSALPSASCKAVQQPTCSLTGQSFAGLAGGANLQRSHSWRFRRQSRTLLQLSCLAAVCRVDEYQSAFSLQGQDGASDVPGCISCGLTLNQRDTKEVDHSERDTQYAGRCTNCQQLYSAKMYCVSLLCAIRSAQDNPALVTRFQAHCFLTMTLQQDHLNVCASTQPHAQPALRRHLQHGIQP